MGIWGHVLVGCVIAYVAVCFGAIAARHGRNPVLFGVLSVISPVNLVILGIWAFSRPRDEQSRMDARG